jgi:opacity protein-like surface antigen
MKKPLIAVAVAVLAASGASAALAAVPGVTSEASTPPKVKPKTIVYTGDGSGLFAGATKVSKTNFGSIHWSKWNKTKAVGSGGNWLNDCKPSCASGKFHGYPVKLTLTMPKVVAGKHIFTRMTVTYTQNLPAHAAKTTTWKVSHSTSHAGTLFFWKFPPNAL